MNRTAVGNLHQALFLLIVERSAQLDLPFNLIQLAFFCLTIPTISGVNFLVV
jgi:hypothetical protein